MCYIEQEALWALVRSVALKGSWLIAAPLTVVVEMPWLLLQKEDEERVRHGRLVGPSGRHDAFMRERWRR